MGIFLNIISSPGETLYKLSREKIGMGGFLVTFTGILSTFAGILLFLEFGRSGAKYFLTWGVIIRIVLYLITLVVITSMYHYFANVLGGLGDPVELFKVLPYSMAPFCFTAPAALIIKGFMPGTGFVLMIPVLTLFLLYSFYIQFKAVNYFYGISVRNTVSAFLMPWFIILGAVLIIPLLILISLASFLT